MLSWGDGGGGGGVANIKKKLLLGKSARLHIGVRAIFFTGGGGGGGGGAVSHLPKKSSQVAQMFTTKSKRNEGHRPTYEVKIFLQLSSYELIKHVKRNSCLGHFDGQRYQ